MDMNELYREALECLAKASRLLTDAQELELAGAIYEISLDVATAASSDVSAWLARRTASISFHSEI
jgi:hypothetical protein